LEFFLYTVETRD